MKNKKSFFRILTVCLLAAVLAFAAVACKPKDPGPTNQKYNPEERPLAMSISTPDGVFNPFFSTSAYDSTIVGMTQIGMLGTDKEGNITCGDNEPVVVKDYRITTASDESTTTYEFILKNGIKFSDGQPLTMKDVLFNLYVYLDPAYTGSATIYSTKIVGLNNYRKQQLGDITDSAMSAFEQGFYDDANMRITDLVEYLQLVDSSVSSDDKPDDRWSEAEKREIEKDYLTVAAEFKKELESDWNNNSDVESYKDWGFTQKWQVFLLNDGQMTELLATDASGKYIKDDDGNYQLNTEEAAALEAELNIWLGENPGKTEKDWAIEEMVYSGYFPGSEFSTANVRGKSGLIESILVGWVTADTIRNQFAAEAKESYFEGIDRIVPTITGIDGTGKTNTDYHGNALGEEHEVLKITIEGVDPKAIWNFAFTVAPMHYYSTNNYEGKDYIASFDQTKGEFGLKFGSIEFMNNVINAPDKVGLPVGAGTYMASSANGGNVNSDTFFNNNMIYFERNPYFETLGSGISNAKIKYLRYKVVETDQVINALANGDIDFGDPSATQENIAALNEKGVAHKEVYTSGYGYVGINPRFVPNITVRRAIMKAMDTTIITQNYYKGGLADLIYRPMSTTSWAYPKGCTVYKDESKGLNYEYDATGYAIEEMIKAEGYTKNANGVYEKEIPGFGTDTLDYKFTLAGGSTDHPAYAMFLKARDILNRIGFNVKVVNSNTALSDLTTGKLAVWAAAWSSTIDPDMYQVYHKDSKATSVNNWGYLQIRNNTELYATEWQLINELSELIDAGRATVVQDERKEIYSRALDKVMELAVEMPTYQRKDMSAYNSELINESTLTPDTELSPYNGVISRIWEVNYN